MKIIEETQVRSLIDHAAALGAIEEVYRAAGRGEVAVSRPPSMALDGAPGTGTTFKIKGAVVPPFGVAGVRLLADAGPDRGRGSGYLYLLDAGSGAPLGLVSELWLHRLRTACTGLVAVRHLTPPDARTMALVGTGRIAAEFVRGLPETTPGVRLRVASRSAARAAAFAAELQPEVDIELLPSTSPAEAVSGADVVVTISDADAQLFPATALRKGALVCALGGRHEFDVDVLDRADRFIVDEFEFATVAGNVAAWIRTGQRSREAIEERLDATIGQVLAGLEPGRRDPDETILAVIQGMAVCDVALAKIVLDRAR